MPKIFKVIYIILAVGIILGLIVFFIGVIGELMDGITEVTDDFFTKMKELGGFTALYSFAAFLAVTLIFFVLFTICYLHMDAIKNEFLTMPIPINILKNCLFFKKANVLL